MDKIKLFLAVALLAVVSTSCESSNNGKFAEEIETVDSLLIIVEGFEARLNAINADTLSENLAIVSERSEFFQKNYPDSNDRKFWVTDMNYLGGVKKAYSRFEENSAGISRQLDESKKQLTTLRNSLEDEKLTEEEARKYVEDEAQAVMELKFGAQKMLGRVEEANVVWDSLRPYFDSIAMHLQAAQ